MLHSWCDDVLEVYRPQYVVERGSKVRVFPDSPTHTVSGCSVQATSSTRDFANREVQSDCKYHVIAPPDADLQEGDLITCAACGNAKFQIDGIVYQRKSPTGRVSSTQVDLIAWEG